MANLRLNKKEAEQTIRYQGEACEGKYDEEDSDVLDRGQFSSESDPDRLESEERLKSKEALQAHEFRDTAFTFAKYLSCGLAAVWVFLIFCCPQEGAPTAAYYLWGAKVSLCTILLVSIVVGMMRFAIRCYGHHQHTPEDNSGDNTAVLTTLGKVVEALAKTGSH